jgi:hypothetical protein
MQDIPGAMQILICAMDFWSNGLKKNSAYREITYTTPLMRRINILPSVAKTEEGIVKM